MYGLQAMDFARGPLSARKAWFFFDDEYVCLGAGITCDSANPVVTSMNQCLLDGDVRAGTAGAVPMGETVLGGETWVHHDDVGYVLAAPTDLTLATGTRTGSWSRIGTGSPEELTRDVFDLRIEHGPGPDGAEYAYIVLPAVTAEEAQRYAQDPPVEILANTPALQACRHPGVGVTGLAFYEAGAAELEGLPRIEVDRPCLLLWRETDAGVTLSASDPSHGTGTLTVTVGDDSVLTVDLPEGLEAGSGVTQEVATR
jgi:chondroitin AC lyase